MCLRVLYGTHICVRMHGPARPRSQPALPAAANGEVSPDSARQGAARGASQRRREEWGARDEEGSKEEDLADADTIAGSRAIAIAATPRPGPCF